MKTTACSRVLQLMDRDLSYTEALKKVLDANPKLNKTKLEKELSRYI